MKRRRVKLLLPAVVSGVALAIVAALSWPARPIPAFRFLHGREPTELRTEDDGDTFAAYRLEGDFNNICAEAMAELADLGFHGVPSPTLQAFLQRSGGVEIYKKARMFGRGGPNDSLWVFVGATDDGIVVSVERMRHPFDIRNWPRYLVWRIRNRKQLENQRVRPASETGARRQ
jgi:hypothetical protein